METEVFLDTSYVISLASPGDAHHQKAVELAQQIEEDGTLLVTTRGVLLEVGNALARARYRDAAVDLLEAMEEDPKIEVAPGLYRFRSFEEAEQWMQRTTARTFVRLRSKTSAASDAPSTKLEPGTS